ncbi:glycosyltransferase family 9 protein [Pseudoteredinibacter isoporae]|uniref:Heptosyltransferase-2 n=1 Tax=Pseudoteredinibacter isoporae TaxID=570281 RepID=A0A7X0JVY8_9GAMM|nr:glycosyltransferase family 9 protein [Pseudoteredinibacter isoporae]MBB6522401.1 heptosyltransferase-2 [Pseudoteredinibacter isoporae]NHO87934.1 glycosyltransferase family 9 protein [Pseudoteredinibacter isoporae]NIB23735.1 glycosyltransferase family 9 protein [Pseudoteredinibacter isoporae]
MEPKVFAGSDDAQKIKKILIVRWGSMGDLVVCSAVMEDICRHFKSAEIHLNVEPPWHNLFKHDPRFSKLQVMKIRKAPRVSSAISWIKMLRQEKYDLIVDLQCNDRSRLLLSFARLVLAAPKLSIATRPAFPYRLSPPQYAKGSHAIEITRAAAKGLGVDCLTNKPMIHWDQDTEQSTKALLEQHGLESKRFVILVPGSSLSGALKRWGSKNYSAMAKLFAEKGIERCVILGGPDEVELCAELAEKIGEGVVNLCGKTDLLQIPVIAREAAYMVSNDTGTAHLAAAADVPMAVICGPTDANKVRPIGDRVVALQAPMACFKEQPAEQCMAKVSPEQVWQALEKLR